MARAQVGRSGSVYRIGMRFRDSVSACEWYYEGERFNRKRGDYPRLFTRYESSAKKYGNRLNAQCQADALAQEHKAYFPEKEDSLGGRYWSFVVV